MVFLIFTVTTYPYIGDTFLGTVMSKLAVELLAFHHLKCQFKCHAPHATAEGDLLIAWSYRIHIGYVGKNIHQSGIDKRPKIHQCFQIILQANPAFRLTIPTESHIMYFAGMAQHSEIVT